MSTTRHSNMASRSERQTTSVWAYIVGLASLAAGVWLFTRGSLTGSIDPSDLDARVEHVMKTTPLIDGHNDIPYLLRLELKNKIYNTSQFSFETGKSPLPLALSST
jgi:membrane dipeptidase